MGNIDFEITGLTELTVQIKLKMDGVPILNQVEASAFGAWLKQHTN